MTIVSVDRALKELQNDTLFPASCLAQALYLVKFTLHNLIKYRYRYFKRLYLYLRQYKAQPRISFCSSFKILSTDTSFIERKLGHLFCYYRSYKNALTILLGECTHFVTSIPRVKSSYVIYHSKLIHCFPLHWKLEDMLAAHYSFRPS